MEFERINFCILDILKNYKRLLETKDSDLIHHVLFSFKNYND
jgi:hypothetical protein